MNDDHSPYIADEHKEEMIKLPMPVNRHERRRQDVEIKRLVKLAKKHKKQKEEKNERQRKELETS